MPPKPPVASSVHFIEELCSQPIQSLFVLIRHVLLRIMASILVSKFNFGIEGCLYAGCLKQSISLSNLVRASFVNNLKTVADLLLGINWMLIDMNYFLTTGNIQTT